MYTDEELEEEEAGDMFLTFDMVPTTSHSRDEKTM